MASRCHSGGLIATREGEQRANGTVAKEISITHSRHEKVSIYGLHDEFHPRLTNAIEPLIVSDFLLRYTLFIDRYHSLVSSLLRSRFL